jgi:hypothetical protein
MGRETACLAKKMLRGQAKTLTSYHSDILQAGTFTVELRASDGSALEQAKVIVKRQKLISTLI